MDGPFWGVLASYGPGTAIIGILTLILAAFVRAVLTGRLVPRQTVEDLRQDRNERVGEIAGERDLWREAYQTSEQTRQIVAAQLEKLVQQGGITNELLTSLRSEVQK